MYAVHGTLGGATQTDPISNFTCFYYEYDAERRVTKEVVFGKSNESITTTTLSGNEWDYENPDYNDWYRKSVETRLDGATSTVYRNYLGQPLLSDLYDGSTHWYTYNVYDSNGRLVLSAEPSAVSGYAKDGNENWNQAAPTPVT